MNQLLKNVREGKGTSGLAGIVAVLSLLGLEGDPATTEAVHQFLAENAQNIASLIAVIALLFAPPKKDEPEVEADIEARIQAEVERRVAILSAPEPERVAEAKAESPKWGGRL